MSFNKGENRESDQRQAHQLRSFNDDLGLSETATAASLARGQCSIEVTLPSLPCSFLSWREK